MLSPQVRVVELSSDDAWMRDTGPTFVVDGGGHRRGVDWRFNAWGGLDGGLYSPWDRDERVASKVLEIEGDGRYRAPVVMEGGSIHVDGEGTVLTTEECLLNPNRNPELSRAEVEQVLCDYLGASKVVWLGRGVYNDETDGHVDNLACFAQPGVVLLTWVDDESDPQHEISREAEQRLAGATEYVLHHLYLRRTFLLVLWRGRSAAQALNRLELGFERDLDCMQNSGFDIVLFHTTASSRKPRGWDFKHPKDAITRVRLSSK